ncbi:Isoprene synthase, chloroplastic, partial [Mucuna pruriens]
MKAQVELKLEEKGREVEEEEEVQCMMKKVDREPLSLLELIDHVQRLGLTYKFENDIIRALENIVSLDENDILRWWSEMGLAFVLDRLMKVYFWALGMAPDPQFIECRKLVTKMFGLVTIIDNVYDVYGTLEELQLFTDAVERFKID